MAQKSENFDSQNITMKKLKKMLAHKCSLPPEEDIVVRYINSGNYVYLRRRFRNLLIVSEDNPRTIAFLKSSAAIKLEKRRHLHYHYHIIHPFSEGRAYWEFIMMFVLIFGLILFPIENARSEAIMWLAVPKYVIEFMFLADCVMTFFTGYYEKNTKKIVLSRRDIFWRYVLGFFLPDFLGSIPPSIVKASIAGIWGEKTRGEEIDYIKTLQFFKILRIPTMIVYIDRYREWAEGSTQKTKIFKLILVPSIVILWLSFALWYIALIYEEKWIIDPSIDKNQRYLICLLRVVLMSFSVSYGTAPSQNTLAWIPEVIIMIGAFTFYIFILAQTLQIVSKYNQSVNKYFQMIQSLREYCAYMRLPDYMKARILEYFDYRFQKMYFKEDEIMNTLSDNLRHAIILHSCKKLLEKVMLFQDLPPSILIKLVTSMKSEIYLSSDVIVSAGTVGDSMFFILTGTVAVYTGSGKEIAHLTDGSHFGEIAIVSEEDNLRVASVIAIDKCELYRLNKRDFARAIEPYPDLYYRIKKEAQSRLEETMTEERSSNTNLTSNLRIKNVHI